MHNRRLWLKTRATRRDAMTYSTVTGKGQTTLPNDIRKALNIRPGDRLAYEVKDDRIVIRVLPNASDAFGMLRTGRRGSSFAKARAAATKAVASHAAGEGLKG